MATVFKTDRGWVCQWEAGRDRAGHRVRDSRTFATEKEAIAKQVEVERSRTGTGKDSLEGRWLQWVEDREATGKISAKTAVGYRQMATAWGAVIGGRPYKSLITADIEAAYTKILKGETPTGRKPSAQTAAHYLTAIRTFFNAMLKKGEIDRSPAFGVDTVTPPTKPRRAPSLEELRALIAAADTDARCWGHLGFIVRFAAHTGLRRAEIVALRWSDIDADRLHVRRAASQVKGEGLTFKAPKTSAGSRSISIEGATIDLLSEHKRRVLEMRLAAQVWEDNDLVLPTPIGEPINMEQLSRIVGDLRDRAGIPRDVLPLHGIRHYNLSQIAKVTGDLPTVQKRAGHSSYASTQRYLSVDEEQDRAAAAAAIKDL